MTLTDAILATLHDIKQAHGDSNPGYRRERAIQHFINQALTKECRFFAEDAMKTLLALGHRRWCGICCGCFAAEKYF